MENYSAVWKILEELSTTLKSRKITIPNTIVEKLRSTLATINIYNADPTHGNIVEIVESHLADIEIKLMTIADNHVSSAFSNVWMERINKARSKEPDIADTSHQFRPGIPRKDYWIRFKIGDTVHKDELKELVVQQGLSLKEEGVKSVIIHGEEKKVKQLVKEMTKKMREKRRKT